MFFPSQGGHILCWLLLLPSGWTCGLVSGLLYPRTQGFGIWKGFSFSTALLSECGEVASPSRVCATTCRELLWQWETQQRFALGTCAEPSVTWLFPGALALDTSSVSLRAAAVSFGEIFLLVSLFFCCRSCFPVSGFGFFLWWPGICQAGPDFRGMSIKWETAKKTCGVGWQSPSWDSKAASLFLIIFRVSFSTPFPIVLCD